MFLHPTKAAAQFATEKKYNRRIIFIFALILTFSLSLTAQAAPGDLDTSFGVGGKVITPFGNSAFANAMAIQPDGKIVVAGGSDDDFALARYNTDGSLDNTFGTGGKVTTSITLGESASGVVIQTDGKIVAAGTTSSSSNFNSADFALVRYNADGSLDTAFGTGGKVVTPIGNFADRSNAVAIQTDGKIIAAGYSSDGMRFNFALARYNTDGTLDGTFGVGGKVITVMGESSVEEVAIQSDGKILAVGRTSASLINLDYALARYNTDGSLDSSFGNGGKVITDVGGGNDFAYAVAIQADGKIVAAGRSDAPDFSSRMYSLVRYNTDGSLDVSFGTNGKVITPMRSQNDFPTAVAIQPDGKFVVGGYSFASNSSSSSDFALVRYNSNGSLDTSFGTGGKVFTPIGNSSARLFAVAIQADGKIIAAGSSSTSNTTSFSLVRYLAASNVRTPFDFDGDGKADVSVFRPSNGDWYLLQSQNGFTGVSFGINTDKIVPADYDGDGKTDVAVFRSGTWYLQRSQLGFTGIGFGEAADIPIPADYDGDGKADVAVFRPGTGAWYLLRSQLGFTGVTFGQNGDRPVAADYDGDGNADVAVNRNGTWYIQRSQLGFTGIQFGDGADKPVPADYDGDGKADVAVFRPSNGAWYLLQSAAGFTGVTFGLGTDLPVPADYDGDGKTDIAVFREGNWYLQRSTAGFTGVSFGAATDKPVPNAFIP